MMWQSRMSGLVTDTCILKLVVNICLYVITYIVVDQLAPRDT